MVDWWNYSWVAVCPKCKGVFFYGKFCPWCGFNVEEKAYCEKCKKEWDKKFNYCPICGHDLVKVTLYRYVSATQSWDNNTEYWDWDWDYWNWRYRI